MVRKTSARRSSGGKRQAMEGLPAYSTLEVAKHSSPEDAWIIIGGKVLNVSSWLDEHPGGDVVLLDLAGRDATREFEDVGHSGDARARIDSLVIGTVRPATDEELRISRGGGGGTRKPIATLGGRSDAALAWAQENSSTLKKVGMWGAASAAAIVLAVAVQRYGSGMYSGRR